jgi:Uma2 family endonuclease
MTALLEVPAIRQRAARLSVADFHRLGEGLRAELLNGILIEKMPKSPLHQFIVERLRRILSSQIEPAWIVRQEGPITFSDSEPEPDLAVVAGPEEAYRSAHPTTARLVIETAISSLEIDRVKALIYAQAGVHEYWIVCPEGKQVEIYRLPGANGYAERIVLGASAILNCEALPGVSVDLGRLFS